jgi:hypothetical protein
MREIFQKVLWKKTLWKRKILMNFLLLSSNFSRSYQIDSQTPSGKFQQPHRETIILITKPDNNSYLDSISISFGISLSRIWPLISLIKKNLRWERRTRFFPFYFYLNYVFQDSKFQKKKFDHLLIFLLSFSSVCLIFVCDPFVVWNYGLESYWFWDFHKKKFDCCTQ